MDKVKLLFEDMSYGMVYRFLDEGKDKDELTKVGKRNGMVLPSPDLAIFKGKYGFVDKQNKNKCTLPKEEVETALKTLNHKAVDIDHLPRTVVGHWIEASLEDNTIIAYGCFLKNNFKEEYRDFKEKMEEGKIKISFEAWGNREYTTNGSYNLRDVHFAGGALLDETEPAFSGAEVLEFAKIIETGDDPKEQIKEISRYYLYDVQSIVTVLRQVECPSCKEQGYLDIHTIDFMDNKVKAKCMSCDSILGIELTPATKLIRKGRKVKKVTAVKASTEEKIEKQEEVKDEIDIIKEVEGMDCATCSLNETREELSDDSFAIVKDSETGKIRLFPIIDKEQAGNALTRLDDSKVKEILGKLGISIEDAKEKIEKRAKELDETKELDNNTQGGIKMKLEEKIKELEVALKAITDEKEKLDAKIKDYEKDDVVKSLKAKEEEVAALKTEIEGLNKKVEGLDAKDAELATAKEEKKVLQDKIDEIEEAKKQEKIKARRDELGDASKDVTDEDVMNDDKFENLKLKKENAELKKKVPEKAGLEAGSTDNGVVDDTLAASKKIHDYAWSKESE